MGNNHKKKTETTVQNTDTQILIKPTKQPNNTDKSTTKCGFISIIGRPNVGKSTLLNHLLSQKLAITSPKPQTTQHAMHGIVTIDNYQYVFIDTPGIHEEQINPLNNYMNKQAIAQLNQIDIIIWIIDRNIWQDNDDLILKYIKNNKSKLIIVFNKIDKIDVNKILPHIEDVQNKLSPKEAIAYIPISALKEKNIDTLWKVLKETIPESPFYYDSLAITNRNNEFFSAEFIREQIIRSLGEELPYSCAVIINNYSYSENKTQSNKHKTILNIDATIYVEREGQKKILIGKNGEKLKRIATNSRKRLELLFDTKIMMKTWVKVKKKWNQDVNKLRQLGYEI